jgi:glycosyltransferase involved in cell wall biosynthesis
MILISSMKRGGAPRFASILLDNLDRELVAPELAVVSDEPMEYSIPQDVPVYQLSDAQGSTFPPPLHWPNDMPAELASDAEWVEATVDRIAALVNDVHPDIVISSPEWTSVLAAAASDRFPAGTRLVSRVDAPASVAFPPTGKGYVYGSLLRTYFNRADRIVAVSQAIANDLVENFGVESGRVVVLHNLVDVARAQDAVVEPVEGMEGAGDPPTIVFVGRLERVKGLGFLLRSIAEANWTRPVRCVLVGGGSQEGYLRALARHLDIEDHIVFAGTQDNPFKYLARATAFVLPSLSEGMPTVMLEAMACGCPVIATDIAGGVAREVLEDGRCGLIVPLRDSQSLTEAILRVVADSELRDVLICHGYERVADFDLPRIIEENQRLLLEVAAEVAVAPMEAHIDAVARKTPPRRVLRTKSAKALGILREQGPVYFGKLVIRKLRVALPLGAGTRALASQDKLMADAVARRTPGSRHLIFLVPTMDDESIGSGTEPLLRHIDRDDYTVSLVRIFDQKDSADIPSDVEQYLLGVLGGPPGSIMFDELELPEDISARYRADIKWMGGAAEGLVRLATGLQADAIVAEGFYASILATLAKQSLPASTAVVARMHTYARSFQGAAGSADLYGALLKARLNRADTIVAPVALLAQDIVGSFGATSDRVLVVPDPIEIAVTVTDEPVQRPIHDWFEQGGSVVLCESTGASSAGIIDLIEALALARQEDDLRLLIVGRDVETEARAAARRLQVEASVSFIDREGSLRPFLVRSLACVHSTTHGYAGIPKALVEAAATGCPMIATRSSDALCEFLGGGERGVLVPDRDPEALAEAMLQVAWDDSFRQEIALAASQYLETVATRVAVPRFERIIQDAIREAPGAI